MVSAAIGAEQYYTTENNAARTETVSQARDLDFRVLNSWVGHPNIRIIDNSTNFKQKIDRTVTSILQSLGLPKSRNMVQKKFSVDSNFEIPPDTHSESFDVDITYLSKPNQDQEGYSYVRRRGQNGTYAYTHSFVRHIPDIDEYTVQEHQISGREYVALLSQKDPSVPSLSKKVTTFLHNGQYLEINQIGKLAFLKTGADNPILPPWVTPKREVTGKPEYSTYNIAKASAHRINS